MGDRTGYYGNPSAFNQFAQGYAQGQGMGQDLATQRAGGMISAGDYTGASNALARSGQLDAAQTLQDQQHQQHASESAERLKWMGQAADSLAQIPDDDTHQGRRAALQQHVLPTLQAMGIDPQTLQAIASGDLSDQSLAMFKQKVAHQYQLIQRRDGSVVAVNPQTLQQTQVMAPMAPNSTQQGGGHIPFGWELDDNGDPHPMDSFVQGRARIAGATRAPARGRSGGGGHSAAIPAPPSGWSAK